MGYRLFIAIDVIAFLEPLSRARRRELLAHFERLQDFPRHHGDYVEIDEVGRHLDVSIFRGMAIYYWVDDADQQVKILKLVTAD